MGIVYLLILFLVIITPPLILVLIRRNKVAGKNLPPGPRRLPLIGNLLKLDDELPYRSLLKLSNEFGPVMFLQLGSIPTLVVSSADIAKEIFRAHDLVFSGRPKLYSAKKFSYGCVDITFAPYGEYWRQIRKITILELLSAKRVASSRAVRAEEIAIMMDTIRKSTSSSSSSSVPVNLTEMALCFMNNVICRVAFGRKYEGDGVNELQTIFHGTMALLAGFSTADFFPWLAWIHKFDGLNAKLEKNFQELDDFYDKVIDEHLYSQRSNPELEDLVDVLIRIQKDPGQGITLSRDQIKGIITDMFIAGSDTSSAAVEWAMTELTRNPIEMNKVQNEVRNTVGNKGVVEESDLSKLKYLKLVIKEAMRLHPPAPLLVPRETTDNCTINGYYIPAKTRVFFNAKAISMDPNYWEDPEEFRPERFLDNNLDFKGKDFEFIPFGFGRRSCPGINFAVVLIELVIANLLYCFDWELPPGMESKDVDLKEKSGLTMHKKFPLYLVPETANLYSNASI